MPFPSTRSGSGSRSGTSTWPHSSHRFPIGSRRRRRSRRRPTPTCGAGSRRSPSSSVAKGRELRTRIRSVENTRRITRTMEMVATSKLKRAQDRVVGARPYAAVLREMLADLYSPELADRFPLLRQPAKINKAAVLLLTSNRGLAGGFNANLIREARGVIERLEKDGASVDLHVVGRKGLGYFRYVGRSVVTSRTDI